MSEPTNEPEGSSPRMRDRAAALRGRADELRSQASATLDDASGKHATVRTVVRTYDLDRRRFGAMLAGGLAFKMFLWLLPYALVVVSIAGFAASFASKDAGDMAHEAGLSAALVDLVAQGVRGSTRGRAALFVGGLWLVLWAGRGLFRAFGVISAAAWELPINRAKSTWKGSAILAVGMTGVFALQLADGWLYAGNLGTDILASCVMVAAFAAIWLALSTVFPRPDDVPWSALLPGALLMAVGARAISLISTVYFAGKLARIQDLYGALGIATVFLAWLFLVARLIVASAFLNAARWFEEHPVTEQDGST